MPRGNPLPEGGSVGLLAGLGSLDDPILPHTGNNAGDFLFGERRHRHANTIKPVRRGPVDQGSLIILQEVCNLGGACLAREATIAKVPFLCSAPCPSTCTAACGLVKMSTIATACNAIASMAKDAATAMVRGDRFAKNPVIHPATAPGARLCAALASASIAAISLSATRDGGAPSVSLR